MVRRGREDRYSWHGVLAPVMTEAILTQPVAGKKGPCVCWAATGLPSRGEQTESRRQCVCWASTGLTAHLVQGSGLVDKGRVGVSAVFCLRPQSKAQSGQGLRVPSVMNEEASGVPASSNSSFR